MPAFPPGALGGPAGAGGPAGGAACARLEPTVAAAFTRALSDALQEMGVGPEEGLQRERFKLFEQGEPLTPPLPPGGAKQGGAGPPLGAASHLPCEPFGRRPLHPADHLSKPLPSFPGHPLPSLSRLPRPPSP
jgi:hypothetical protein